LEGQRVVIWGFDGTLRDSTLKTRQGDLPGYFSSGTAGLQARSTSLLGARHFQKGSVRLPNQVFIGA
jgi:hypothetical protein